MSSEREKLINSDELFVPNNFQATAKQIKGS